MVRRRHLLGDSLQALLQDGLCAPGLQAGTQNLYALLQGQEHFRHSWRQQPCSLPHSPFSLIIHVAITSDRNYCESPFPADNKLKT